MAVGLFVYGTLTDPQRVQRVLGHPCETIAASLKGYERQQGKWPYVTEKEGHEVQGSVLLRLSPEDFVRLDEYEVVFPVLIERTTRRLYTRELVDVLSPHGCPIRCWVYLPNLSDWPYGWR
jgi:gamma-glutamylcyclotransferase (GGCT)/AIG2-like uncharacterized protein YtfP